jgi:sulfur-oxidizing protein SoxA
MRRRSLPLFFRLLFLSLLLLAPPDGPRAAPWFRPEPLRSDLESLSPGTQRMQRRDAENPAWFAVQLGEQLYKTPDGQAQRACAECHGLLRANPSDAVVPPNAAATLSLTSPGGASPLTPPGAAIPLTHRAAYYPRMDDRTGQPIDLSGRIEACRQQQQRAAPWDREDPRRLALQTFVAVQSRGHPLTPDPDPRLKPARERGHERYTRRIGQLGLSCADCHDKHWGGRLGGSLIPQGHPNAYPLWRLQWQAVGSLQRRIRACLAGVRAQAWPQEDPAWIELELYLQWRAAGLPLETPGVRP